MCSSPRLHLFCSLSNPAAQNITTHNEYTCFLQDANGTNGTNGKLAEEDDEAKMAQVVCSLNNRDECLACGS